MEQSVSFALWAALFTWALTALGAAVVLVLPRRAFPMEPMLGFAAGVMLSASFWSLLLPAAGLAEAGTAPAWFVVTFGFLLGAFSICLLDRLPMLQRQRGLQRGNTMLLLSITAHNIPEGLAVGVAFGALGEGFDAQALMGAAGVAIGIGLQNFPEGAAVSLPLHAQGMGRGKSFLLGQATGAVEPLAALAGAALVSLAQPLLPWCLAFAAGAMILVTVKELLPRAGAVGAGLGFGVMTALDVMLG